MNNETVKQRVSELEKIILSVQRAKFSIKDKSKLKGSEKYILALISTLNNGNSVSPSDLAKRLNISLAAITHHINSLEKQNLIIRSISSDDRRIILITLSKQGHKVISDFNKKRWQIMSGMVEYLGEEDSAKLIELFKKVSEFMIKVNSKEEK
jgi:DNA-binding MarR family transcriptional regulator